MSNDSEKWSLIEEKVCIIMLHSFNTWPELSAHSAELIWMISLALTDETEGNNKSYLLSIDLYCKKWSETEVWSEVVTFLQQISSKMILLKTVVYLWEVPGRWRAVSASFLQNMVSE